MASNQVKITLEVDDLGTVKIVNFGRAAQQSISQVETSAGLLIGTLKSLIPAISAAFAVDALKTMVTSSVELGSSIELMSQRMGISAQETSQLRYAAQQTGITIDDMERGIRRLSTSMDKASEGSKTQKKIFDDLGISVMGMNGQLKPATEVLMKLADKFSTMTDKTKMTSDIMQLFGGRFGTQLIPLLLKGSSAIQDLMEKSDSLGATWSNSDAAAAHEFEFKIVDLEAAWEGFKRSFMISMAPTFTKWLTEATSFMASLGKLMPSSSAGLKSEDLTANLETHLKDLQNQYTTALKAYQQVYDQMEQDNPAAIAGNKTLAAGINQLHALDDEINRTKSLLQDFKNMDTAPVPKSGSTDAFAQAEKDYEAMHASMEASDKAYSLQKINEINEIYNAQKAEYQVAIAAGTMDDSALTELEQWKTLKIQAIKDEDKARVEEIANIQAYYEKEGEIEANDLRRIKEYGDDTYTELRKQDDQKRKLQTEAASEYDSLMTSMEDSDGKYTIFKIQQLDDLYAKYKDHFTKLSAEDSKYADALLVLEDWKKEQIENIWIDTAKKHGDMVTTMEAAWTEFTKTSLNTSTTMYEGWISCYGDIESGMENILVAGMKRKFNTIGDAWKAMWTNMEDTFFQTIAKIMTQKIMLNVEADLTALLGENFLSGLLDSVGMTTAATALIGSAGALDSAAVALTAAAGVQAAGGVASAAGGAFGGLAGEEGLSLGGASAVLSGAEYAGVGAVGYLGARTLGHYIAPRFDYASTSADVGAIIGGALGSFFGPLGTMAGAAVGDFVGALIGGAQKKTHTFTLATEYGPPPAGAGSNYSAEGFYGQAIVNGELTTGGAYKNTNEANMAAANAALKQYQDVLATLPVWASAGQMDKITSSVVQAYSDVTTKATDFGNASKNIGKAIAASLNTGFKDWQSQLAAYIQQIISATSTIFNQALTNGINNIDPTTSMNTFFNSIGKGFSDSITTAMEAAFGTDSTNQGIVATFLDQINTDIAKATITVPATTTSTATSSFSSTAFESYISGDLDAVLTKIQDMGPAYAEYMKTLDEVKQKIAQAFPDTASINSVMGSITDILHPLSDLGKSLKSIDDEFTTFINTLTQTGASFATLADAQSSWKAAKVTAVNDSMQSLLSTLDGMVNPLSSYQQQLDSLNATYTPWIASLIQANAATADVTRAQNLYNQELINLAQANADAIATVFSDVSSALSDLETPADTLSKKLLSTVSQFEGFINQLISLGSTEDKVAAATSAMNTALDDVINNMLDITGGKGVPTPTEETNTTNTLLQSILDISKNITSAVETPDVTTHTAAIPAVYSPAIPATPGQPSVPASPGVLKDYASFEAGAYGSITQGMNLTVQQMLTEDINTFKMSTDAAWADIMKNWSVWFPGQSKYAVQPTAGQPYIAPTTGTPAQLITPAVPGTTTATPNTASITIGSTSYNVQTILDELNTFKDLASVNFKGVDVDVLKQWMGWLTEAQDALNTVSPLSDVGTSIKNDVEYLLSTISDDLTSIGAAVTDSASTQAQDLINNYITPVTKSWQDFMDSINLSNLAPAQSKQGYDIEYQKLLAALPSGGQAAETSLEDFVKNQYLPFMKSYLGNESDYAQFYNNLFGPNGSLANISVEATIASTDVSKLSDAVTQAIAAAGGTVSSQGGTYYITVKLDNSTLAAAMVKNIKTDPATQQAIIDVVA